MSLTMILNVFQGYFEEIRICLEKDFTVIPCPSNRQHIGTNNCSWYRPFSSVGQFRFGRTSHTPWSWYFILFTTFCIFKTYRMIV